MKKEILIDREKGLTRVAILEDEELCEFYLEREGAEKLAGNIYKGRVQNVLRGMQAAFVDIGTGKNAFLYLGDEGPDKRDLAFPGQEALVPAARQERVVANQDLLVQVVKEPDGTKGARLSTHITLPGRYVVLAPQMDYVGVSRRIAQEGERQRLKAEAERQAAILKAEGEAQAILNVQQALADSIKMLNEANPNEQVIKIKALESFEKAADGQATKIIVPSEIQSLAGLAASFKGLLEEDKK